MVLSGSQAGIPDPVFEKILAKSDPRLGRVIKIVTAKIGPLRIHPSRASAFEALARAIVYQSVSGKAAAAIFSRVKEVVDGPFDPARILALKPGVINSAGLSNSKAGTIIGLAEWFLANPKSAKTLPTLSDDEAVTTLTGIPGIGAWTVNVFLIFDLGRLDVMPANDLGIRRGVQLICGLRDVATREQVRERAELWRPYRSIASIYLWNAVKLKIMQGDLDPLYKRATRRTA